ncbi:hypothetical protein CcCBS67573_g09088 [Chytriomyces confervae]|uniref:ABC transmembrane type-1 domain-containing protein n=1 Tax=Chytriomyces confervae TaxID=246404 RepID=A0A507E8R9_9FUNG|nr:hypothetical protein CcCBS67573_g09088 [Chytriomyces confervae]
MASDPDKTTTPLCPKRRQEHSLYAKWTFSYMNPVIFRGFKKCDNDAAEGLSKQLLEAWQTEQSTSNSPQLWRVILRVFSGFIFSAGLAYFGEMAVKIGEVLFMGQILEWFQNPNAPARDGYLYGLGLASLGLLHAVLHHVEFFLAMRCGLQMRVAFIAAVYKKCLSLSTSHTSSTGYIVNLVSNDVQRFEDAAPFAHFIWLGPLEVVLMTYFMYTQIGYASFAGVAGLLLMIPLQGWFARLFARLRKNTVGLRDERIKCISDSLAGMLVVKLYAWEKAFEDSINSIRDQEMRNIRKASYLRALNEAFFFASGSLIEIFAFVTFWLMGGVFTPAKIFTCIAYMSSIRLSMTNFFPKALQFLAESRVSLDRIQEFLALPISIPTETNGEFGWGPPKLKAMQQQQQPFIVVDTANTPAATTTNNKTPKSQSILQNINLKIKVGELVSVVGAVGSGKSSLLNAILGEMDAYEPTQIALRSKKISFCTQTPFILSGSVRDNVTFGLPFDAQKFRKVIDVCAMESDLKIFQNGELTLIGERGVTLSGGQRARLALARAVYSDADIYLLDDPLSAVDTKVGR